MVKHSQAKVKLHFDSDQRGVIIVLEDCLLLDTHVEVKLTRQTTTIAHILAVDLRNQARPGRL